MEKITQILEKVKVILSEGAKRLFGPLLIILGVEGGEEAAEELSNLIITLFGAIIAIVTNIDFIKISTKTIISTVKGWFTKK